jgi:NAD(P)-dependent dehydrogenase (short-subunit alcohol dehydrogenase family)
VAAALIAGGATGIGREVTRAFRAEGTDVLVADINDAAIDEAAAETLPGRLAAFPCDLADDETPAEAVAATIRAFGRLDVLFANAALLVSEPVESLNLDAWDRSMRLNVRAPLLLAKAAIPHLRGSPAGRIIFTASTAAFRGSAGGAAYCSSKAALVNLSRCLAAELTREGITINCVCPGWIDTPFNDPYWDAQADPARALQLLIDRIPRGRQGSPRDVAAAVIFLASPEAGYVSGHTLIVDGALTAV